MTEEIGEAQALNNWKAVFKGLARKIKKIYPPEALEKNLDSILIYHCNCTFSFLPWWTDNHMAHARNYVKEYIILGKEGKNG